MGLAVDGRAGPDEGADVGDVHPDAPVPLPQALGGDRVVEVLGGDRVDGERRQRLSGRGAARPRRRPSRPPARRPRARPARRPPGTGGASRGAAGTPPGRRARRRGDRGAAPPVRARPRRAPGAGARGARAGRRGRARRSRDGRGRRPARPSGSARAPRAGRRAARPRALRADRRGGPPPRPPPRPGRLTGRRGRRRPRPCPGPRRPAWPARPSPGTSGTMPFPVSTPRPPRLRPSGVKYWPAVMSSAPPLESSSTCWNTPLPNVSEPTTFARSRSWSAPVTISEADAVPSLTRTTSGAFGTTGLPVARSVALGHGAAPRRHDRPVLEEGAGDELGLAHEAAAVVAQVQDERLGALLALLLEGTVDLGVRAGAEARQAHHADLAAVRRRPRPARDDRHADRVARQGPRDAACARAAR